MAFSLYFLALQQEEEEEDEEVKKREKLIPNFFEVANAVPRCTLGCVVRRSLALFGAVIWYAKF